MLEDSSRQVLQAMAVLARDRTLSSHPQWFGTLTAADRIGEVVERNRRA